MKPPVQWKRKNRINGQAPLYTFEEIDGETLRVTRDNDGDLFIREFKKGCQFWTYNGLRVEMESLNPNGGSSDVGYYIVVREVGGRKRKTDVSAQNQIDKLYFQQRADDNYFSANEVDSSKEYMEGSVKNVLVNMYERDQRARRACIEHFGAKCQICGFSFSSTYGQRGDGFIEVHHIKPLHEIRSGYVVDPIRDLLPVCSNCHSIFHRGGTTLTPAEMKALLCLNADEK